MIVYFYIQYNFLKKEENYYSKNILFLFTDRIKENLNFFDLLVVFSEVVLSNIYLKEKNLL